MNHTSLVSSSHDEAINVLRNAGPEVCLSVMHYRSAAPFLLRNLRQLVPEHQAGDAAAASTPSAEGGGVAAGENPFCALSIFLKLKSWGQFSLW